MELNEIDKKILNILRRTEEDAGSSFSIAASVKKSYLWDILSRKDRVLGIRYSIFGKGQFDYSISKLKDEGMITSVGYGYYKITTKGKDALKDPRVEHQKELQIRYSSELIRGCCIYCGKSEPKPTLICEYCNEPLHEECAFKNVREGYYIICPTCDEHIWSMDNVGGY